MLSFKKVVNISGLIVLAIAAIVYFMSVERTGSLWDCGEFILGAYKLEVVHPPGAGLFILIGRLFTWFAEILSDNPSDIAFSVNMMSGLCSALGAMFIAWSTMILGKLALVGREDEPSQGENIALGFAGLAAGLAVAFSTSIWFSAVEGEVYAMSSMFTAMTVWAAVKWYHLPNEDQSDRWLILSLFVAGLSIGIHLLSILAFPTIALLYYFKKYERHSIKGAIVSMALGVFLLVFVMKIIIVGLPTLWKNFELFTVNTLGMPFHSGLIPAVAVVMGLGYMLFRYAEKNKNQLLQNLTMVASLLVIGYSTIGIVVVRSNADTPVNMNTPSNVMRLIPYLNREQYGERPLVKGPHYLAAPYKVDRTDRFDIVGNEYKKVDEKYSYVYRDNDKLLLPRVGHSDRVELHNAWRNVLMGDAKGKPGMAYNMKFMFNYQFGWMYYRYFMWNFAGRQNSKQGVFPWDKRNGHWLSGISFLDESRLYNMDQLPDSMAKDQSRNTYYLLPVLFGLLGFFFHLKKKRKDFLAILLLFLIAGLGIIIYSNQPPQEPRERDYVLVGSFMTFCIWIGFGVLALYSLLKQYMKGIPPALIAGLLVLSAPVIMGFQNFDDHNRSEHYASRDYASNFLNSVDENAIVFTYGDNDTYPLWYAQEVEGIRRDVRVVNLSLIQVDWYINKLRNKVNDSPAIKLSISENNYRAKNLNQIFFPPKERDRGQAYNLNQALLDANKQSNRMEWTTRNLVLPIDPSKIRSSSIWDLDSLPIGNINVTIPSNKDYLTKDEVAILDVIASNIYDRPIYFAVTCKNEKLMKLNDYMQMEGLALRVSPVKSQSERSLAIYGSGRVDSDKAYDNIMNKWAWGNFDKIDTHIDNSYMAEVQAMKFAMLRTSLSFLYKGDNARAADVANKYFEAFPNMNFRYDSGVTPFITTLIQAGDMENAKKHLSILNNELVQEAEFLLSLDGDDLASFGSEINSTIQGFSEVASNAGRVNDPAFAQQINEQIGQLSEQMRQLRGLSN